MTKKKKLILAAIGAAVLIVVFALFMWWIREREVLDNQVIETDPTESPVASPSPTATQESPTPVPSPKPSPSPKPAGGIGAVHRDILGTVFWVGETAGPDNNYITNEVSAWDTNWVANFGGYDHPDNRNGYYPAGFTPKENPFYFALPYTDFAGYKNRKESAKRIPWYTEFVGETRTVLKNRWIAIGIGSRVCYGQWQDIGPGEYDDFDYVFGTARPKNSFTGIDISPALRDCLGTNGRPTVWWQFVEESAVPAGPWRDIITRS